MKPIRRTLCALVLWAACAGLPAEASAQVQQSSCTATTAKIAFGLFTPAVCTFAYKCTQPQFGQNTCGWTPAIHLDAHYYQGQGGNLTGTGLYVYNTTPLGSTPERLTASCVASSSGYFGSCSKFNISTYYALRQGDTIYVACKTHVLPVRWISGTVTCQVARVY